MKNEIVIEQFGERKIAIKGIGKMFFQEGFPISMAVIELAKKGIEVSIIHCADECLNNGWSAKTVLSKFKEDFADCAEAYDENIIDRFCTSSYSYQREMIFQYLFGFTPQEGMDDKNKREKLLPVLKHCSTLT